MPNSFFFRRERLRGEPILASGDCSRVGTSDANRPTPACVVRTDLACCHASAAAERAHAHRRVEHGTVRAAVEGCAHHHAHLAASLAFVHTAKVGACDREFVAWANSTFALANKTPGTRTIGVAEKILSHKRSRSNWHGRHDQNLRPWSLTGQDSQLL